MSSEDVDMDGMAEILTGPGPQNISIVKIIRKDGSLVGEFQAYPDSMRYGVKVSKGAAGE